MTNLFSTTAVFSYCKGKEPHSSQNALPTIWLEQMHTANFIEITDATPATILCTDAAITTLSNLHLKVKHADCLPVLLYHPSPIIGAIHAGRKGTEQEILKTVLRYVKDAHGITDSLQLWFGPAICNQCYQIDRTTNLHYDLIEKNTMQVREVFSPDQATIIYSNRCTAHENDSFYSYRKEGKGVKMNWSGIALIN